MAIDVMIEQKLFGRKNMPLEVILGESLNYGNFENDMLNIGELGENEFIAYNPEKIGRGFSVIWTPEEKRRLYLRLPLPSTTRELKDFYCTIERMVKYWGARLTADGSRVSLSEFLDGYDDMVEFNYRALKQFSAQILDGTQEMLTLYSAMWQLTLGKEEAAIFSNEPERFDEWLHEKQDIDVFFESPDLYNSENGIFGRFFITDELPAIFPNEPTVPFGITDSETGKALECKNWYIAVGFHDEKRPIREMEYSEFLDSLPEDKKTRYDGNHFLLDALTKEEIKMICEK